MSCKFFLPHKINFQKEFNLVLKLLFVKSLSQKLRMNLFESW
ncbi:hypothetical protein LEP1GSC064_1786 [Leptospira kirschneri serovar Grippotyphosa str. Moskva]|nr:hypothetical protein LEP1GSC044_3075 [Leptospira kirschneri serovar Grippotyphosa str. RM52]EKP05897.1 hypothetical protein LEP1GSC018_2243 [Leptospira kirschneri str. 2008720114]EKQ82728.1 hypothetical protein LEP1GSC064_1786 [Leptospira kirschneri serovar Grippotyphosa str. Moskva]EKR07264.1 hypothetical protein LEP1GSC122_2426 [Leptospira kirschneri serovar Valbuzzi str. 200702274]EMJ96423.1 hypothetical protein LEP1GSC198_1701 [Leptospira kirschneri str. JB]EMK04807.1 hypothetical prote